MGLEENVSSAAQIPIVLCVRLTFQIPAFVTHTFMIFVSLLEQIIGQMLALLGICVLERLKPGWEYLSAKNELARFMSFWNNLVSKITNIKLLGKTNQVLQHKDGQKPKEIPQHEKRGTEPNKQNYSLWLGNTVLEETHEEAGRRTSHANADPVCEGWPRS